MDKFRVLACIGLNKFYFSRSYFLVLEIEQVEKKEPTWKIRRDIHLLPTAPQEILNKSKNPSVGVGRAMIRRLTGIVTNSSKTVDFEESLEQGKFRSFHKKNKFSSVFGKSHRDEELFRKGFASQRRPATLGLEIFKNFIRS